MQFVCIFFLFLFASCFVLVYWHIVCLFQIWFSIMSSAFNLLVFPNSMFTTFLFERAMCTLEKLHSRITINIIIIVINCIFYWYEAFAILLISYAQYLTKLNIWISCFNRNVAVSFWIISKFQCGSSCGFIKVITTWWTRWNTRQFLVACR